MVEVERVSGMSMDIEGANKEKLMQENPEEDDFEKNLHKCDELKAKIKDVISKVDSEAQKKLKENLKAQGLPIQYTRQTDPAILEQVLAVVSA